MDPDVHVQLRAIRVDVDATRTGMERLTTALLGSLENPGGALSTLRSVSQSVEDLDGRVGVLETRLPKGTSGSYVVTRPSSEWSPRAKLAAWAAALATIIGSIAAAGGLRFQIGGDLSAEELRQQKIDAMSEPAPD